MYHFIGIPKTIDNDLGSTENSIGFSTAVSVATEALDRLQPTAASHDRVMILEVMGRDAGHIALSAGIAGNADVIIIPEIPYKIEAIARHINKIFKAGRNFALVIVAEAVKTENGEHSHVVYTQDKSGQRFGGIGQYFAKKIMELTGAESRFMTLGHVQRGAPPVAEDRILASAFGVHAVNLINEKKYNRMVAWSNRSIIDVPIVDAINEYRIVQQDDPLLHTAQGLGIYLGEL